MRKDVTRGEQFAMSIPAVVPELKVSERYLRKPTPHATQPLQVKQIILAFYNPGKDDPSWVNRLVVLCSKYPYSHCELVFNDGLATSIMAGGTVFCKLRSFANPNYILQGFNVTAHQHDTMYQYALDQSRKAIPFSNRLMLAPVLGSLVAPKYNVCGTFCSQHIVKVLRHGQVKWSECIDADMCSPSMLFETTQHVTSVCFNTIQSKLLNMQIQ
jgi:hypothetical protein